MSNDSNFIVYLNLCVPYLCLPWTSGSRFFSYTVVNVVSSQVLAAPPSGMPGPVPSAPALSALGDGVGRAVSPSPAMIAMSMFNTSRSAKSLKDLYAITREFNMNKCLPRWPAECQVHCKWLYGQITFMVSP